jgi:PAS domain S-box-containing protein
VEVPADWWREACEVVNHPMACVADDNRFVWVNSSFERLCGYSSAELLNMTWMEITLQSDVGGDLASVQSVINGDDTSYTLSKRYKHKLGKKVPVQLTVWRFPLNSERLLACFIVEAIPKAATTLEVRKLREEMEAELCSLRQLVLGTPDQDSKEIHVSYNSQNADRGGSNSNNNTTVVALIAAVMVAGMVGVSALIFGGVLKIETYDGGGAVQVESDK